MKKNHDDVCEIFCFDEEKVDRGKEKLHLQDTMSVAKIFKALADDTRVKIAYALSQEDELCVCDVANIVGSTMATASHHLRLLRNMGLAKYRKEGKLVFYSLDDDHVKQLIELAFIHSKEVFEANEPK
ncbi:ArsR/SmtB family transcription factor [Caldalkalibacillus mannanilyticus]|uniref:ArsR/SmtB family transcription factor n=1 Tax=Caldalkalibacillus mannanilyticus TaxID=1418 RepID=UPI00046A33A4|nr:metalloregulator ArsR/SmtB family transcription factor [Caldalkalibacillus mannanilyticus]